MKARQATIYASEAFRAQLLKDGGQYDQRDPNPVLHLHHIITKYLPGYLTVLPTEYHFSSLVRHGRNCLDLAFLNAVWRYAERVDPKYFPCPVIRGFKSVSSGKPLDSVQSNALKKRPLSAAPPNPAKRKKETPESEKPAKKVKGGKHYHIFHITLPCLHLWLLQLSLGEATACDCFSFLIFCCSHRRAF